MKISSSISDSSSRFWCHNVGESQVLAFRSVLYNYIWPTGDFIWGHDLNYHLHADNNYIYAFSSDFYSELKTPAYHCLLESSTQVSKQHLISNMHRAEHLIIISSLLPQRSPFQLISTPSYLVSRLKTLELSSTPPFSYSRSSVSANPIQIII